MTYSLWAYVQVSLDRGDSWISLCPPAPAPGSGYIHFDRIAAACSGNDGSIAIAAGSNIHRTTDDGQTWSAHPVEEGRLLQLLAHGQGMLYAGGKQGVSRSSDGGVSWLHFNAGLTGRIPYAVLELPAASLMLLGRSDLHISEEEGRSWRRSFTGSAGDWIPYSQLEGSANNGDESILSLKASLEIRGALETSAWGSGGDHSFFVWRDYHSSDNGNSWVRDTMGLEHAF